MTFTDLFNGIGGFRLAFERVGFKCVFACEKNRYARQVYEKQFKINHPFPEDIREVDAIAECDLVCAGVPCQDVSLAGKRKGLYGENTGLFFEFIRLLERTKPRWVLFENVPGLLSSNRGRDFAVVLNKLGQCGYGLCWRILDSQYFGVPQRRRRVFIVGYFGAPCSPQVLFESESGKGTPATVQKTKKEIAYALTASTGGVSAKENQQTLVSVLPRSGGDSPDRRHCLFAGVEAKQKIYSQEGVRRLTPLECERLQGFPDGWTEGLSDTQRYKCLGNAVTVPVIEWIAKRIKEAAA